jgi:hypothetical protein
MNRIGRTRHKVNIIVEMGSLFSSGVADDVVDNVVVEFGAYRGTAFSSSSGPTRYSNKSFKKRMTVANFEMCHRDDDDESAFVFVFVLASLRRPRYELKTE